jgi:predicted transcriptional regulator of viral defense system
MNSNSWRVCNFAERQQGVVATWQMRAELALSRSEIVTVCRRLTGVFRGVYAIAQPTELGWYRAATLALGPEAVLSHSSALMLMELRPYQPSEIHVSVPRGGGRRERDGIKVHRRTRMEVGDYMGIPRDQPHAEPEGRRPRPLRALPSARGSGAQDSPGPPP